MRWATRVGCHVDRVACAWLIVRFIDDAPEFVFVPDGEDAPEGATPFDMPGAELSHHGGNCTFETMLDRHALRDESLRDIGRIIHEADLADERYDAPEAPGLDIIIRGMSLVFEDAALIHHCLPLFDGLYAHRQHMNAAVIEP